MKIDESAHVIVHAEDLSVTVNGLHSHCLTPDMLPKNMRTMTWRPNETPRGHFHGMPEGTHTFDDFTLFAPFIAAWRPHYEAWVKDEAAKKVKRDAETKAVDDANAERERSEKDHAVLNAALGNLQATCFRVLRAMEADLAARGVLSADFVKERNEWHAIVSAERKRLGYKD